jgi:hypothetical protein
VRTIASAFSAAIGVEPEAMSAIAAHSPTVVAAESAVFLVKNDIAVSLGNARQASRPIAANLRLPCGHGAP